MKDKKKKSKNHNDSSKITKKDLTQNKLNRPTSVRHLMDIQEHDVELDATHYNLMMRKDDIRSKMRRQSRSIHAATHQLVTRGYIGIETHTNTHTTPDTGSIQ